jgi:hypothetical protein
MLLYGIHIWFTEVNFEWEQTRESNPKKEEAEDISNQVNEPWPNMIHEIFQVKYLDGQKIPHI